MTSVGGAVANAVLSMHRLRINNKDKYDAVVDMFLYAYV